MVAWAKTDTYGVHGGQACFPPGAFGGTIGNGNLVGLQGEIGWGYHIYEGLRTTWEISPP